VDSSHDSPETREVTDELSIVRLATALIERTTVFIVLAIVGGVIGTLAAILPRGSYTTYGSFISQGADQPLPGLSNIAAQFGIPIPGPGGGQSPQFYGELALSRRVLSAVATLEYTAIGRLGRWPPGSEVDTVTGSLNEYWGIDEGDPAADVEAVVEELRSRLIVEAEPTTGIVSVGIRTHWPAISYGTIRAILDQIARFDLEARRSQARAERIFVASRLEDSREQLRNAENELEAFLVANRQWSGSPELTFQHDRLQRVVSLRSQVVTTLAQAFEQARIEEVRNTPVITLVEEPVFPARPDRRRLVLKAAGGAFVAGLLGMFVVAFRAATKQVSRRDTRDVQGLDAARRKALGDLRKLLPWGRRRRS
jgi:uncharacterized protein involved in exopolysaccharide biosynthesis